MDQGTSIDKTADDIAEAIFYHKVKAAHDKLFGAQGGPYNIDSVAYFAAAIESYQYARDQMRKAARFDSREGLLDFSLDKISLDGLVLEFGVFSGHTINIIADKLNRQMIHGFDSFKGLPEDWTAGAKAGAFARDGLPAVRGNVDLVVGWFDDTLRTFLASHPGNISFLHVDCDLYSSTRTILTEARDRIVPGTVILFDEYFNYPDWKRHEHRAFQEFVYENSIKYEYIGLVPAFEQVAARIL
ncbi:class I SAM-dependent methyltransferase [Rhizobium sp. P38BS-XIX]|uniref:class I SAM-dependent methyltransferase n=1 Tax=Rhizobium sp. P38BS-XIX TaxID=2726740 RepID=UPI001456B1A3|nr:class I SAM-dependent methyltransferase [Rhizobium sp. P38BS-XIX]NLR99912.1 class I SAM-dependent methyltransferase [Rhizobium sp. P38BS-XIX]